MDEKVEKKIHHVLPGPIELAKEAWIIFKKCFVTIAGLAILQGAVVFAAYLLAIIIGVIAFFVLGGKFTPPILIVGALLFLVAVSVQLYLMYWFLPSYAIKLRDWNRERDYRDIIKEARQYIGPMFVTALVLGALGVGATFAFIIPGIIFRVWFMFWFFVVVIDKRRGLLALHTSREYVRGHFWGVVGRVVVVYIPELLIGVLILLLTVWSEGRLSGLGQIFQVATLFVMPFYGAYLFALFMHLKKLRGEIGTSVPKSAKMLYVLTSVLGFIIVIAGLLFLLPKVQPVLDNFVKAGNPFSNSQDASVASTQRDLLILLSDLNHYKTVKGGYPAKISDLNDVSVNHPAMNYDTDRFEYDLGVGGSSYSLCVHYPDGKNVCGDASAPPNYAEAGN